MTNSTCFGNFSITLCVSDNQYEQCADLEFIITPVNDAPVFISGMDNIVGLNVPFDIELGLEDVDSETLTVSFLSTFDYPEWLSRSKGPRN